MRSVIQNTFTEELKANNMYIYQQSQSMAPNNNYEQQILEDAEDDGDEDQHMYA